MQAEVWCPVTSDTPGIDPPVSFLETDAGARIAYHRTAASANQDDPDPGGPGIVFLGGFMSDMTGTKATALEAFAKARGRAFLRFDYQGHGASSGAFEEGTIGLWASDALAALDALTEGPQILVGSSMGGWIALLTALARPRRVAALIGIAAAPDFTDRLWASFSPAAKADLEHNDRATMPSDYGEEPYVITRALIEDGRTRRLLTGPIPIHCPVRLLQGTADSAVPWETAFATMERLESADVEVILVKDGDHRLSGPRDLARLFATLDRLVG